MPPTESRDECPDLTTWKQLLDGQLDRPRRDALQAHLDRCEACEEACGALGNRWSMLASEPVGPDHSLSQETLNRIAELASGEVVEPHEATPAGSQLAPEIPGLSDLVAVGHGGMGTVYLAWETALRRPVAVKILTATGRLSPTAHLRAQDPARSRAAPGGQPARGSTCDPGPPDPGAHGHALPAGPERTPHRTGP
jgi:anti-sigma factor RsiW